MTLRLPSTTANQADFNRIVAQVVNTLLGPVATGTVSSFNTRTGAIALVSGDVTAALGFTPLSSISSSAITTALGYVPTSVTGLTGVQSVAAFKSGLGIAASDVSGLAAVATAGTFASLTAKPTTLSGYGITDAQGLNALLTAYAGAAWSAGVQIPTLTAANTVTLKTVGSATGNILDKASGDALYLAIGGTATAATKLATGRTLAMTGDVAWTAPAFDGTGNVTAAGTIQANAVTFAKFVAATQKALVGATAAGNFGEVTLGSGLTLVAGVLDRVTQTTVSGNAGTATALQTPRTISITGKATSAGGTFDGTGNLALNITAMTLVAGDIPNIAESQVTNLTTDLAAKAPLASPTFTGTAIIPKINQNSQSNTANGRLLWNATANYILEYIANGATAGVGPGGNLTSPTGTIVTNIAIRSVMPSDAVPYGWTWEINSVSGTAPTIVKEMDNQGNSVQLGYCKAASFQATGTVTGSNLSGTNTGDQTSVSGNAGTATKLQTPRNINGVPFDGSANVTIPGSTISVVTKTAGYTETTTSGEIIILASFAAGGTIVLPTAVGNTAKYTVKKLLSASTVVIDGNASETIDGGLTATLTNQYEAISFVSDNANWWII